LALIEAADLILPTLQLGSIYPFVVVLTLLGFPVAVVLAWAVEVTPEGVQRTADLTPEELASTAPERWSPVGWSVAGVGILAVLVGGYFVFFRSAEPLLEADLVAVAVFDNETGDPALDPLGKMISQEITQGLTRTSLVRVVHSELVLRHAGNPGPAGGSSQGSSPGLGLARETGAGLLVSGSYYLQGESVRIRGQVIDPASGEVLAPLSPTVGSGEDPGPAVAELTQRAMAAVAQRFNPRLGDLVDVVPEPRSFAAYQDYSAGMDAFLDREMRRSIDHFNRALQEDPTYADALLYLAVAHWNVNEYRVVDSILAIVEADLANLTPLQRSHAELVRAWTEDDREGAYRAAKAGARIAVSGNWGWQVAREALRLNRVQEALEVLLSIDPEAPDIRGWADYWRLLTGALHGLGRHEEELEQAERAVVLYPTSLGVLQDKLEALAALGRMDEVRELLDGLGGVHWERQAGGRHVGGLELKAHGFEEEGQAYLEEALTFFTARPAEERRPERVRRVYARYLYDAGRWDEAGRLYEVLSSEDPEYLEYLGRLGTLAARRGDAEEARRISQALESLGGDDVGGDYTGWRARIHSLLGEEDEAVRLLRSAHQRGYPYSTAIHLDIDLFPLRGYPPFEDFIRPKG
jgi:tetratricopeptide (TPR) repeat protein/TolB-like protein